MTKLKGFFMGDNSTKPVMGLIISCFSYAFGSIDGLVIALFTLFLLDWATAICRITIKEGVKGFSWKRGVKGVITKFMLLLAIPAAVAFEYVFILFGISVSEGLFRSFIIGFLMLNEGTSIVKNYSEAGFRVPRKVTNALDKLRNALGEDDEKDA